MVLWGIAVLALLVAVAALTSARRLARKLDAVNQAYWELRYDYTRLRSQVARLDPEQLAEDAEGDVHGSADGPVSPTVSFVPLSSIRKRD